MMLGTTDSRQAGPMTKPNKLESTKEARCILRQRAAAEHKATANRPSTTWGGLGADRTHRGRRETVRVRRAAACHLDAKWAAGGRLVMLSASGGRPCTRWSYRSGTLWVAGGHPIIRWVAGGRRLPMGGSPSPVSLSSFRNY